MEKTNKKINEDAACWYAVYTVAKAEEKVKKLLEQSGFECYLPLQSVVRVWNSHTKKVMIPVIQRVVFVCLSKDEVLDAAALGGIAALLLKREECYVSVSSEQLRLFQDQVENADGFIEFVCDGMLSANLKKLVDIDGLGTAILRNLQ